MWNFPSLPFKKLRSAGDASATTRLHGPNLVVFRRSFSSAKTRTPAGERGRLRARLDGKSVGQLAREGAEHRGGMRLDVGVGLRERRAGGCGRRRHLRRRQPGGGGRPGRRGPRGRVSAGKGDAEDEGGKGGGGTGACATGGGYY